MVSDISWFDLCLFLYLCMIPYCYVVQLLFESFLLNLSAVIQINTTFVKFFVMIYLFRFIIKIF